MIQGSSTVAREAAVVEERDCSASDFDQFGRTVLEDVLVVWSVEGGRRERLLVEAQRGQVRVPVEERERDVPQQEQKGKAKVEGAVVVAVVDMGVGEVTVREREVNGKEGRNKGILMGGQYFLVIKSRHHDKGFLC